MNERDRERDMYIYTARKAGRTFADIGRELGIGANRVGQLYRRMDYEINRHDAEHLRPDYGRQYPIVTDLPVEGGIHISHEFSKSPHEPAPSLDYNQDWHYPNFKLDDYPYEKSLSQTDFDSFQDLVKELTKYAEKAGWDIQIDADNGTPGIIHIYIDALMIDQRERNNRFSTVDQNILTHLFVACPQYAIRRAEHNDKMVIDIEFVYDLYRMEPTPKPKKRSKA